MTPEIIENLIKVSESLDKKGLTEQSSVIDSFSGKLINLMKSAQYVGSQGYWVANSRCWGNCYRKKRSSSQNNSSQKAFEECLFEYQKAVNEGSFSEWEKYANDSSFKIEKYSGSDMFVKISESIKEGESIEASIAVNLQKFPSYISENIIRISSDLISLSRDLDAKKISESDDIIKISSDLIKESQWWKKVQDFAANSGNVIGNIGKGIGQGLGSMVGGFPGSFVGGVQGAYNAGKQKALDDSAKSMGFNNYQEFINSRNPNQQNVQPISGTLPNQNTTNNAQNVQPAQNINSTVQPKTNTSQQSSQKNIMTVPMLDAIFSTYVWPKETLSHIAKWYNNQIKSVQQNNKSNISSSPSSQTVSPQSSSVAQSNQAVAQNADLVNLFGEKGGPKVSSASKSYWDNLVGDQKRALISGKYGEKSGSIFTSPIPVDLINAIKSMDDNTKKFLQRTSSKI